MANFGNESRPWKLNSAVISSQRYSPISIQITDCISDINIYEDINKPFLTGKIAIVDFQGIFQDYGFNGDEKITLQIIRNDTDAQTIERTFYLDYIMDSKITSDAIAEVFYFHMVEDSEYESTMKNVNRYYEGKPSEIIRKIIQEYMPTKNFITTDTQRESNDILKVIIPNLTPMEAIQWVCQKAVSVEGLPYFLFTSLLSNNTILYMNLYTILTSKAMNRAEPYTFWQSTIIQSNSRNTSNLETSILQNSYQILDYEESNNDNLRYLVDEGLIGSTHRYVDILNGQEQIVGHNINSTFYELEKMGILSSQNRLDYVHDVLSTVDDENLGMSRHKKVYNYPSLNPYELGFSNNTSMSEENSTGKFSLKVNSLAILNLLYKRRIQVNTEGSKFLNLNSVLVGGLLDVNFLRLKGDDHILDNRKSGKQLITSVVHIFKKEDYSITFELCKLEGRAKDLKVNSSGGQNAQEVSTQFQEIGLFPKDYVA